jgi:hypothetical protein
MAQIQGSSLEERTGAFVERVFGSLVGATDLFVIDLGRRLGLYEALAEAGATSNELADRTGCAERYVREWLEHQAVSGILDVDDVHADPSSRRYSVPEAHREPLIDQDSLAYVGAMAYAATALARPVAWMVDAFKTGAGVPYERYGEEGVAVQGALSRPMFASLLTTEWLPSLPELEARLQKEAGVRIADVACGIGLAATEIANAIRTSPSTGLTATRPRSPWRERTPRKRALPIASDSRCATVRTDRVRTHTT